MSIVPVTKQFVNVIRCPNCGYFWVDICEHCGGQLVIRPSSDSLAYCLSCNNPSPDFYQCPQCNLSSTLSAAYGAGICRPLVWPKNM